MDFIKHLTFLKNLIDEHLKKLILNQKTIKPLEEILLYPLECGGKRIRPALCLMTYDFLTRQNHEKYPNDILILAASLEFIHTYSLVHDDLPAMDDDTLRRGKPTVHVQFNEAKAILSGDGLLTLAFNVLAQLEDIDVKTYQSILKLISDAAGPRGMVAGQILDIENENKSLSLKEIETIHELKTGKMIGASALAPLFYVQKGDNPTLEHQNLKRYSEKIGLAFQIVDDVLDLTQTSKTLGKNAKSDIINGKSTYATLLGLDKAMNMASECVSEAKKSLDALNGDSSTLKAFADFVLKRLN